MMNWIVIFVRFLFSQKWKILLTGLFTFIFLVYLFPLGDLNDVISSQVSKLTGNKVFVQFDDMHLNPFNTSVSLDKVYVETPQISSIGSDELIVSPSISALLAKKPGGRVNANGFLKGEVELSLHPVSGEGGADKSKIELAATNISLKEVREAIQLQLPIKGQLSLTSQAIADLNFSEQPDLDLNLTISKFELASTSVNLESMGSIGIPEVKFGKVELKGKLAGGKFQIESGKLGSSNDEFYGDIKGDMAVSFQNVQGQITPVLGAYNLMLDLKATESFREKAQMFLMFLDGYKVGNGAVSQYKLQIQAAAMGLPPQMIKMQ